VNRIYRLVFNTALGQVQVASELASHAHAGGGDQRPVRSELRLRTLAVLLALCCAGPALAAELPTGGSWGNGTGNIGAPVNDVMQITQSSQRGLINWSTFNIGSGGTVNFAQAQGAGSVTLNVVNGGVASNIAGNLTANGQVFLINANGILFGATANVNVGGLVASSLGLASGDYLSNSWQLSNPAGSTTMVVNQGTITAAGSVNLIGTGISNSGVIQAPQIGLTVGRSAALDYVNEVFSSTPIDASTGSLYNGGVLFGATRLAAYVEPGAGIAINNAGIIQANAVDASSGSLTVTANGGDFVNTNGIEAANLSLSSTGNVSSSGTLAASGTTSVQAGNDINLGNAGNSFGGTVALVGDDATLAASGGLQLVSANVTTLDATAIGTLIANGVGASGNVTLDGGSLVLGTGTIGGNLAATSVGAINQTGAISVVGSSGFDAGGAITLNQANSFGGTVSLSGSDVSINGSGALTLGSVTADSLSASADSLRLSQNVSTLGMQAYQGPVTLLAPSTTLASTGGGAITFDNSINGASALRFATAGQVSIAGNIGTSTALASLDSGSAGSLRVGGQVIANGGITLGNAVVLTSDTTLNSLAQGVAINGTVNAAGAGVQSLTINSGGTTSLLGNLGSAQALRSLQVNTGAVALAGDVTTTGAQRYNGAVALSGNSTLTSNGGGDIGFANTVDGSYALQVNTAGTTRFEAAVGATTALDSLATNAGGTTRLAANVSAWNNIGFGDAVVLDGDSLVQSPLGSLTFNGSVTGAHDLTASSSGTTAFNAGASVASLSANGPGSTILGGDVSVTANAFFYGDVVLANDVTVSGNSVSFNNRLDGAHALEVEASSLQILGPVGVTTPLSSLRVETGVLAAFSSFDISGNLILDSDSAIVQGGAYRVGGDASFSSMGDLWLTNAGNRFGGTVALSGADVSIASSIGLDLDSVQTNSLHASAAGALRLDHADILGAATLDGATIGFGATQVGGNLGATGSTISQTGALAVSGTSTFSATGAIDLTRPANQFGGTVNLTGTDARIAAAGTLELGAISANSLAATADGIVIGQDIATTGAQQYQGTLTLDHDTTLTSGSTLGIDGSIDGSFALTLDAAGLTTIEGDVGQATPLASLDITGAARIGGDFTTLGNQSFGGALNLADDSALTSTSGNLVLGDIDGAHALALQAQNHVTLGTIGANAALASLRVIAGNAALQGGSITTTGAQRYTAPLTLGNDQTLTSTAAGNITFDGTVDGAQALTVNTAGTTAFGAAVGGSLALTGLATDAAGGTQLGGSVAALNGIAFHDAVTLAAPVIVQSLGGDVSFGKTITGAQALVVDAASGSRFGGAIDIGSLQVSGGGNTTLGGNVTVGTNALFGRPVVLAGNVDMAGQNFDFNGGIEGAYALDVQAGGHVVVAGDIGAATPLASLSVGASSFSAGSIATSGNLGLDTTASLTQSGAYQVGGDASFASAGDIALLNAGNRFDGTVALSGADVSINAGSGLDLEQVQANSLQATATGGLGLGNADIAGTAIVDGATVAFDDVRIGGDLTATSSGAISQSAALQVTGTSTLAASGDIALTDSGNRFGGALDLTGHTIAVNAVGDLDIANLRNAANAAVALQAGGALSLGGAAIDTGSADLSLSAQGGALLTTAALSGAQLRLSGRDGITLGGDVTAASLSLGSDNAAISQNAGALNVGGSTAVDSGTGAIALTAAGNHFGGAVSLQGGTVAIHGADALQLATVSASRLDASAGNGLAVDGATVAGQATLDAGAGALTLNNVSVGGDLQADAASIDQTGTLDVTGAANLASLSSMSLAAVSADSLIARAGSGLTLDGATVEHAATLDAGTGALAFNGVRVGGDLYANGAAISQTGTLDVTGAANLTSTGNIGVSYASFGSLAIDAGSGVNLADTAVAGGATVAAAGSLSMDTVRVGGDLQANGASINQTGTLDVTGAATFTSAGAIALGSVTAGTLDASAGNGLDLADVAVAGDTALDAGLGALAFGDVRIGGDLQASGASIGQRNRLRVDGSSQFASPGDIRLDQAGNTFAGGVTLRGGQVVIAASGDLALDQVDAAALQAGSTGTLHVADARVAGHAALAGNGVALTDTRVGGDLDIASGQDISQTGAVLVGGASRLGATGAIVLDNAGNDFQGAVSANGHGIRLVDANDLQVAALGNSGVGPAAAGQAQAVDPGNGDVSLVAGGNLSLPAQGIDIGDAALSLQANGGRLTVQSALAAGDIQLGARDGIALGADISAARVLDLRTNGTITQGGGRLFAATLTGQAGGAATLAGDNRIATLGDFSAASLVLGNASSLTVAGDVQAGSSAQLDVRGGDLRIDGRLAADAVRLQATGAIDEGVGGSIATAALSGRSGGATRLGTADGFAANQVARLGDFAAAGGFSLTNASTLTLGALNGSDFSVDTGDAAFFLQVDGGDLLQQGTTPVYAGDGHWWSSGRIGTSADPIYVITSNPVQVVDFVGLPPAYFFAVHPDGTPVTIGGAVNLPTTAIAERAQSGSLHRVAYVDVGALNAEYRAFGIVQPGIRLPADQAPACDSGDPDAGCTP